MIASINIHWLDGHENRYPKCSEIHWNEEVISITTHDANYRLPLEAIRCFDVHVEPNEDEKSDDIGDIKRDGPLEFVCYPKTAAYTTAPNIIKVTLDDCDECSIKDKCDTYATMINEE